MLNHAAGPDGTAGAFLLVGHDARAGLPGWLQRSGALAGAARSAPAPGRDIERVMCTQMGVTLDSLLSRNLVDVLLEAWGTAGSLRAAARATAADPGRTDHVNVATQKVTWSTSSSVDLLVDEVPVGTATVTLQVVFDITALEADVRAGRIYMFQAGKCSISASLAVNGFELAQHHVADIAAPVRLRIDSGDPPAIPLPENSPPPPPDLAVP